MRTRRFGLAEGGGELVHDAAGDVGEIVLGFLAEQGFFAGLEAGVEQAFEEGGGGALERGGGGKTGAAGDGGKDEGVEAGNVVAAVLEAADDAAEVVRPFRLAFRAGLERSKTAISSPSAVPMRASEVPLAQPAMTM